MKRVRRSSGLHANSAFVFLTTVFVALLLQVTSAWGENFSMSKTATELDTNHRTQITLSIPSEEEKLDTMVVFALDKSQFSDTKAKALELLSALKAKADETGASIKVGVVEFNRTAHPSEVLDLATQYDQVEQLFTKHTSGGTNMHAGLLAAQEMLDSETSIPADRKYMVLVSDGSTYLYCPDGDYTKCFSRAYSPFESAGGARAYGGYYDVSYYQPSSTVHGNIAAPTTADATAWQEYLADVEKRNTESNGNQYDFEWKYYDEAWPINSDKAKAGYISMIEKIKEQHPGDDEAVKNALAKTASNIDMSRLYSSQVYQEIAAKYHAYAVAAPTTSPDGQKDGEFLKYLNGGDSANFDEIQNEILYAVGAGSNIDDYMGVDFDFVNEASAIQVKVGNEVLAAEKIADNEYGFGKTGSSYRYVLKYTPGATEHFNFQMNEPVTNFARVQLVYQEQLVNVPSEPGDYTFDTNKKAILHPVDSEGNAGADREFAKPTVSLSIAAPKPNPDPEPQPKPDSKPSPKPVPKSNTKKITKKVVKKHMLPQTGEAQQLGVFGFMLAGGVMVAVAVSQLKKDAKN